MTNTTSVILCAGRRISLGKLTRDLPKPMIDFEGKPLLRYTTESYRKMGIKNFVIPIGYKGYIMNQWEKYTAEISDSDNYTLGRIKIE